MTHLPLDELGDVDAASRDPHVAGCEQCRRAVAEQRSVRDLLGGLPAPSVAPPDVVRALEATLRRLSDVTGDAQAGAGSQAVTVVPLAAAPSRRAEQWRARTPALLAAAAAVVVAAGLGGLVVRGGGEGGTATSAGASAELRTSAPQAVAPLVAVATGTAYTRARLTAQVEGLLARRPVASDGAAAPGLLGTPAGLRGCLTALAATGAPLAVDVATFDGSPAAVFVLPAAGGGREVWVVAPSCRPGADGTRYFTRLP